MDTRTLPDGWTWTTLGDVCKWGSGGTPLRGNPEYYDGDIPWVIIGDLNDGIVIETQTKISQKGLENSSAKWVEAGSILLAMYGSIGKLGIAGMRLTTNQAIAFTKPESVNAKYLFYYLMGERDNLLNRGIGATQQNISQTIIKSYSFPLAPQDEQKRIVAKIEELFTQLEAGTVALQRLQAGLKRYKASVLKAAAEGYLLPSPVGRGARSEGELPEGWKWVTLGELAQFITSGSRGWAKYYSESGSLFVRVGNFNGLSKTIDLTKKQFVNAPKTVEGIRTQLRKRDLLITMTADVGMTGIVDENTLRWGDAYINQHVGLVRLKEPDFVDFVAYALASEFGQKQFREKQYGATKVGLNFEDIRSMMIPLASLSEQRHIVAEVERRLSFAQEVEGSVLASLQRAARLRQAVLKRAFEGRV